MLRLSMVKGAYGLHGYAFQCFGYAYVMSIGTNVMSFNGLATPLSGLVIRVHIARTCVP